MIWIWEREEVLKAPEDTLAIVVINIKWGCNAPTFI